MLMPRGMGWAGEGASASTCPSGQWNPSLQTCCAPGDGTVPAMDDPCSIFNQPAYLATQTQAQSDAEAGDAGNFSSELVALNNYTQPVQQAAIDCVSNPGNSYTDAWGNQVQCPAAEMNDNGIWVSIYTAPQIAAMIAGQFNIATEPANAFAGTTVTQPGGTVPSTAISTVAPATTAHPTTKTPISSTGSSAPAGSTGTSNLLLTGVDLSFLTDDSLISGVPNWGVAFGALAALMILPGIISSMGRR